MAERRRIDSIDWARGLVMVLMALDHCRDYFGDIRINPVDLDATTPALFATRWVTHICAPAFVFLAGVAAALYGAKCASKKQLARFLWTRGVWLLLLEFTVVYFAWTYTFALNTWYVQVIAAIGVAMIALAGLVFLPRAVIAVVGVVIIAAHNLLDSIAPADLGGMDWLWRLAHEGGVFTIADSVTMVVLYPLLPWIGVIALGYAAGPVFKQPRPSRQRFLTRCGLAAIVAFVVVRSINIYGDPGAWSTQDSFIMSVGSFLNCAKYPPSFLFLLMTLGPTLLILAAADRPPGFWGDKLIVLGRVPLFFYIVHLYAIHLVSRTYYLVVYGEFFSPMRALVASGSVEDSFPSWYEASAHSLALVYVFWAAIVVGLWPLCRWFGDVKQRSNSAWLSYF